ncbi:type I restriction endonuclease subunit R [Alloscardovia omnicolens]|uniref:type I restriction endonuclease subunit R n=1 Tax=Alloscardovia omnicolens TaxID=419015 RepID=UPI0040553FBF
MKFLENTQPNELEILRKIYKEKLKETIISAVNSESTKRGGSLLDVLKHGIDLANVHLMLMYAKPATSFNAELTKKYEANIFSISKEEWSKEEKNERVDLVIHLNGLAIISIELKCNNNGQSYSDAICQYCNERDPKSRLFLFKAGTLVNFAMDLEEVHMTTRLAGKDTFFLPFNLGQGEGVNTGKGNPRCEDDFPVSYMWKDILTKDSILELISRFIYIDKQEKLDEKTGKKKLKETIIFPRYHQLRAVRRLLADVVENGSQRNYLIQHSAGSGKTKSIAWLAHRLASQHNESNEIIFNNVVIVTDRVVVDRQLQTAVMGLEHKLGLIRVMGDNATSADLAKALMGNTKIIATTIQKFPYIIDTVEGLKDKRFAVIIDEAHFSTAGKDMAAITQSLGSGDGEATDYQDQVADEIRRSGKQPNVSFFAFTATPKATTLQLFGTQDENSNFRPFDVYSMKQAIEEGFILDVLQNYTTYNTFFQLNKAIEEDPECKTSDAKRQIARFVALHDTNIQQRIEIIIEHFRTRVMGGGLGNTAKAMVITGSRQEAVKYRQAFEEYTTRKGYKDIHALVDFSGKVSLEDDDTEYTEAGMNGFSEAKLTEQFKKDDNRVLLVANKYQTGFDQPKLCAMYVLKTLRGVSAVQTLSRLNRICPPYQKRTFVLDFVNTYEDIQDAFAPYYETTMLSNTLNARSIYELNETIDAYRVFDPYDVEKANELFYKGKMNEKAQEAITFYLGRAKQAIERFTHERQIEFQSLMRSFVRCYEFLVQATSLDDIELRHKYNFIVYLLRYFEVKHVGGGIDLKDKVEAQNFVQKKAEEYSKSDLVSEPFLKLPLAEVAEVKEEEAIALSQIIDDINNRMGKNYDPKIVSKTVLQVMDALLKSDVLKISAKTNSEADFSFTYSDAVTEAMLEILDANEDFFSLLLNNPAEQKAVFDGLRHLAYEQLRNAQ